MKRDPTSRTFADPHGRAVLRRWTRLRGSLLNGLIAIALLCGARDSRGQTPAGEKTPPRAESHGLIPASDRDAEAWLKRAAEAAENSDWKLAVDTLMRVIEQYGDKTVSPDDGQHYYSARRCVQDQIRRWPRDGLDTYRILYDPEAKSLLDRAATEHDVDLLRRVWRIFPLTTHGPEAMDRLAAWLIDDRKPGEAIEVLHELLELPHADMLKPRARRKLVMAYELAGDPDGAERTLKEVESAAPQNVAGEIEPLRTLLATARGALQIETDSHTAMRIHPGLLGPPASAGRCGPIDPAVTPEPILTDALPGCEDVNPQNIARLSRATGRPPVWQMVSDGRSLFVSCGDGIMARDLDTFEFFWKSVPKRPPRDPRLEAFRIERGTYDVDNSDRLDEPSTRTLFHEYRGAISTAMGLVFVIEQAWTPNEQYPTREGVPAPNNIFSGDEFAEPNSLRAYEADTGRAAWTKGRGGPVEDGFRGAHFLATPVSVHRAGRGEELIAPVQIGADLALLVMNRDGETIKSVPLGTGQPGMFPMNGVLPLTVYDGTIYVQTGAGLMIALSAMDDSLRWQTPYARAALTISLQGSPQQWGARGPVSGRLAQPDEWLASPPLIVGGLVIVAAPDSEQLLALHRATGEKAWSYPRGSHRYLVGSDGERVLVAGRGVLAIDAATGRSAWSYQRSALLGRPALCGDILWLPTEDGLVKLDARTGEVLGDGLRTATPPGNLLAIDGALYCVSATSLTKYPDFAQSQTLAEKTLAAHPEDPAALLRLAHLHALRKDWKSALALLERADHETGVARKSNRGEEYPSRPPASARGDEPGEHDLSERIRHQRVTAMLRLAQQLPGEESLQWLTRAASLARRGDDVVESGSALIDAMLDRNEAMDAMRRALELLDDHGDEPMQVEDELVALASVSLSDRLRRAWEALSPPQRRDFTAELEARAERATAGDEATSRESWSRLIRLADAMVAAGDGVLNSSVHGASTAELSRAGAMLDLRIGRRYAAQGDPETAEYFLRRCKARGGECDGVPELGRGGGPGGERGAVPEILKKGKPLQLVGGESVAGSGPPDARSFFDASRPIDLHAEVVPIRLFRQIKGVCGIAATPASAMPTRWSAMLDTAFDDLASLQNRASPTDLEVGAAAWNDSMAVLDADGQFIAVGLSTGRVLWPAIGVDRTQGPLPTPSVLRVGDSVALAIDAANLLMVPARGDARPIWRRRWPGRMSRIAVCGGNLAVIDRDANQVALIEPATGRLVRRVLLRVPGSTSEPDAPVEPPSVSPILCDGYVVYVDGARLLAKDLASGRPAWERAVDAPPRALVSLGAELAAVVESSGAIDVIRAESGSSLRRILLDGLELPPIDLVLDRPRDGDLAGARLLIFTRTLDDPPQHLLLSTPIESGKLPWRRELGRFATISRQMMRAGRDYVAAVQYLGANDAGPGDDNADSRDERSPRGRALLYVFDKWTGERLLANPYALPMRAVTRQESSAPLIRDVIILDTRLIAVGLDGYYVLSASPVPPERATNATE